MTRCPACDSARHRKSSAAPGIIAGEHYSYLVCLGCGGGFVAPVPSAHAVRTMYESSYVESHYTGERSGPSPEALMVARNIVTRKPGARVLDVGCGAGGFLVAARAAGALAEGQELNASTAEATSRRTGFKVHAGALSSITESYDVVHAADVLEHVATPAEMLVEMRALLSSDGLMILRGPLEGNWTLFDAFMRTRRRAMAPFRRTLSPVPPWHLVLFSWRGWNALLERAGLHQIETVVSEEPWPPGDSSLKHAIRSASMALSRSSVGRRAHLGNRVLSVCRPRGG